MKYTVLGRSGARTTGRQTSLLRLFLRVHILTYSGVGGIRRTNSSGVSERGIRDIQTLGQHGMDVGKATQEPCCSFLGAGLSRRASDDQTVSQWCSGPKPGISTSSSDLKRKRSCSQNRPALPCLPDRSATGSPPCRLAK